MTAWCGRPPKLTPEQADELRRLIALRNSMPRKRHPGLRDVDLAKRFGIGANAVQQYRRGGPKRYQRV